MSMRILVVEDEPKMARLIQRGLEREGLAVDLAPDGEEALRCAAAATYDAVVLDRMLPGIDGVEVCRRLRDGGVRTPVLLLTALGEISDRVDGLDAGADDYLCKPFSFDELLARLRALTRRGAVVHTPVMSVDDLRLNQATREVWRAGSPITLTPKEFALLEVFMRHAGQVLSQEALLEKAWDSSHEYRSNVVEVHIGQLRDKIDRPFGRANLETVRGVGYRLGAEA